MIFIFNFNPINISIIYNCKTNLKMSYTAQQIQSMIESNKGLIFTYNYSKPGVIRFVHPMSIVDDNVVGREANTGKIKKFKLTGIQLFKNNQPIEDTECEAYKLKELNDLYINTKLEESQIYNHDIPVPNTPRDFVEEYATILIPDISRGWVSECGCVQECACGECDYCIVNEGYGCGCE